MNDDNEEGDEDDYEEEDDNEEDGDAGFLQQNIIQCIAGRRVGVQSGDFRRSAASDEKSGNCF